MLFESLLSLVEEARILDRDDGLVGEGLKELDVMRSEPARLFAGDEDYADALGRELEGNSDEAAGSLAPARSL